MPVAERFVDTVQGRIHCAESGSGEPLLLLHSNGCSLHEFSKVIGPLGAHFRCIAWDMPGHGDSDRPLGHMSISAYARAVVALMDAMDIQAAHVCGASVGGFICAAIGRIAPERVLSLLVVEAALRSEAAWAGQWPRMKAAFAIPRQTREQVAPRFRAVDDGALARWNIDREKAGGYRMVDVMWAIREFDTEPCLTGLTVPVSVIIGRPWARRRLPGALSGPHARRRDTGHS